MSRPRNEPAGYRAGDPRNGGMISGGLTVEGRVWMNASHGLGVTVKLSRAEAMVWLTKMVELVRDGA